MTHLASEIRTTTELPIRTDNSIPSSQDLSSSAAATARVENSAGTNKAMSSSEQTPLVRSAGAAVINNDELLGAWTIMTMTHRTPDSKTVIASKESESTTASVYGTKRPWERNLCFKIHS